MTKENGSGNKGFGGLGSLVSDVSKAGSAAKHSSLRKPVDDLLAVQNNTERGSVTESNSSTVDAGPNVIGSPEPKGGSGFNKAFWAVVAIIFFVWLANDDSLSMPNAPSYTYTPSTPSPSSSQTSTSSLPVATKPPVGTSHVHSTSEIRWCLAEDIRIESIRYRLDTESQVYRFNGRVNDYNNRCGEYRYRSGTLKRATREIEAVRSTIVAQALARLVTQSRPVPNPVVQKIQRSLSNLGYSPGPTDGFYGTRTKQAIEQFQRDRGFPVTGIADNQLILQVSIASTR